MLVIANLLLAASSCLFWRACTRKDREAFDLKMALSAKQSELQKRLAEIESWSRDYDRENERRERAEAMVTDLQNKLDAIYAVFESEAQ